jgi:nucleotide-binding universal stress UspA family protein
MSERDTSFAIRRILVALDSSPHSLAALDAAADLAETMEAELSGLFVEDVELLRLADAPYARQVLYSTAADAPLDRASMERNLRAQSEQARAALAAAAKRVHVRWSFRTVRGHVTPEVLAAAGGCDLLALGKLGWSLGARLRIGSTALEVAGSRIPVLLLPAQGAFANLPLLVYYDGSPAAKYAVVVAARLAAAAKKGISVLLAASGHEAYVEMQKQVALVLEGKDLVHYRWLDPDDASSLTLALREEPGVLILGGRALFNQLQSTQALLRDSEMPVLLLGNGSQAEAG